MEIEGQNPERPFEYGVWLERLNPLHLEVGDFLYIISTSGAIYELKVTGKDHDVITIYCTRGSEELLHAQGHIRNVDICKDELLKFGDSRTSHIRLIICSKAKMEFSFADVLYNEEVDEVDSNKLTPGDYLHIEDEKGTINIFKIVGRDQVTMEPILEQVLTRYSGSQDRLRSNILGRGYRVVGGKIIRTGIVKRLMVTKSPDEVLHVTQHANPQMQPRSSLKQQEWLSEDVLVSGTGLPDSIPVHELIKVLGLDQNTLTQEELEVAWQRYSMRHKILEIGYLSLLEKLKK